MIHDLLLKPKLFLRKTILLLVSLAFLSGSILPSNAFAADMPMGRLDLLAPGTTMNQSTPFEPAMIKGIQIHADDPLKFTFFVDPGEDPLPEEALKEKGQKLIKYFLASLTVPEDHLWVNLAPGQRNRIIGAGFGETEMGRDLLSQDYLLKQLTASLFHPETNLGAKFWDKVYAEAKDKYDVDSLPMDLLSKVWIVPEKATVYEQDNSAFVIERKLKVLTDAEYSTKNGKSAEESLNPDNDSIKINMELLKEIVIPAITREVNEGANFALLRQVYNSMILATWYKMKFQQTLLSKIYVDQSKISGVDVEDKEISAKIYDEYMRAFKQGVYNYIKSDYDPQTRQIVDRKYVAGGLLGIAKIMLTIKKGTPLLSQEKQEAFGQGSKPLIRMIVSLVETTQKGDNILYTAKANSRPFFLDQNDFSMAAEETPLPFDDEMLDAFDKVIQDLVRWYAGEDPQKLFRSHWLVDLSQYFPNDPNSKNKAGQLMIILSKQFEELLEARWSSTMFDLDSLQPHQQRSTSMRRWSPTMFDLDSLSESIRAEKPLCQNLFQLSLRLNHPVLSEKVNRIALRDIVEFMVKSDAEKRSEIDSLLEELETSKKTADVIQLERALSIKLNVLNTALIKSSEFSKRDLLELQVILTNKVVKVPGMKKILINRIFEEPREYVATVIEEERKGKLEVFKLFELVNQIKEGILQLEVPNGGYFWGRTVSMRIPSRLMTNLQQNDLDYYEAQKKRLLQMIYKRMDERRRLVSKGEVRSLGELASSEALQYAKLMLQRNNGALKIQVLELFDKKDIDAYLKLRAEIKNAFGYRLLPKEQKIYDSLIGFLDDIDQKFASAIETANAFVELKASVDNNDNIFMVKVLGIKRVESGWWTSLYYRVEYLGLEGLVEADRWERPRDIERLPEAIGNSYPAVVTHFEKKPGELFPEVAFSFSLAAETLKRIEFKEAQDNKKIVDVTVISVERMRSNEPNAFQVKWVSPTGVAYDEFVPPHFIPHLRDLSSYDGKTLKAIPIWDDDLKKGSFRIIEEISPEKEKLYSRIQQSRDQGQVIEVKVEKVARFKKDDKPSGLRVVYQGLQGFIPARYMPRRFASANLFELDRQYIGTMIKVKILEFDTNDPRRFIMRMLPGEIEIADQTERQNAREKMSEQQAVERQYWTGFWDSLNKPMHSLGDVLGPALQKKLNESEDEAMAAAPGGIDFHSKHLDLQIKRNAKGIALPIVDQPLKEFTIDGFLPVIIEMAPAYNLPSVLGIK